MNLDVSNIWDLFNLLIICVGLITIYCSIRLASILNKYAPSIWWYICPGLIIWGVINRALVFLFSGEEFLYIISSWNLIWWVGVTIFIREVRINAEKLLEDES